MPPLQGKSGFLLAINPGPPPELGKKV